MRKELLRKHASGWACQCAVITGNFMMFGSDFYDKCSASTMTKFGHRSSSSMLPPLLTHRTATISRISYSVSHRRRCFSTKSIDSSIREFTSELAKTQPVFQVPPSSIRILKEPSQFYATLLVSGFNRVLKFTEDIFRT